jgi:acyl phosphate:glycerol-3-phosphate acyltransferase
MDSLMSFSMPSLVALLLAYLIGSISFAVLVSRAMGLSDPRSYGSGNPGATNVLRSGNKLAAILTLAGDAAKGAVAVLLAQAFAARFGFTGLVITCAGLAAFIGHLYPVFHRFQGGKGVATAAGVLLALSPALGLCTLGTWLLVAAITRYSSLAALLAAVCAPFFAWWLSGPDAVIVPIAIMSGLLIWRHRQNIAKLAAGTESRIGKKKAG